MVIGREAGRLRRGRTSGCATPKRPGSAWPP